MQPFRFNPRSVTDALDGGQVAPGSLAKAINLIFDPANPFTFECRPAALKTYDFSDLDGPEAVSVAYIVGDICYGMIASSAVSDYDQPFAYNLVTNTLITVSGTQSSSTLPLTQPTTGNWTPPTMALVGPLLYVTHPGFIGGASAFFGWFDTTNPAAPVWHSGNTGTNLLPSVPTNVAQFNNRAWLVVKNAIYFTDALTTTISDASHILIIGDSINITALAPQPLITSVQGIIQSLVVFKHNIIALITGDDTQGNLAINIISSSVGCIAPRTISPTPKGLMFESIDGIRVIGQDGTLGDPNPDLKNPFIFALSPSRSSACYNKGIYRVTVQNGHANANPKEEYWFDFAMNGWTGPHTFVQDMAVSYGDTFIVFNSELAPSLWTSDVVQSGTSTFVENDDDMSFLEETSPMPDSGGLYENSAVLSVIDMQLPNNGDSYTFAASDVNNGVLSTASVVSPVSANLWGSFDWGSGTWTPFSYGLDRYNIPWSAPLVFSRMVWQISGPSSLGFKIGKLSVGYQPLKYVRVS